jgi:hypothetical protein
MKISLHDGPLANVDPQYSADRRLDSRIRQVSFSQHGDDFPTIRSGNATWSNFGWGPAIIAPAAGPSLQSLWF